MFVGYFWSIPKQAMASCPIPSKRILVQMEKRISAVLAVKTEMDFSEAKSTSGWCRDRKGRQFAKKPLEASSCQRDLSRQRRSGQESKNRGCHRRPWRPWQAHKGSCVPWTTCPKTGSIVPYRSSCRPGNPLRGAIAVPSIMLTWYQPESQ